MTIGAAQETVQQINKIDIQYNLLYHIKSVLTWPANYEQYISETGRREREKYIYVHQDSITI